jgi:hypothetical protein
MHHYESVTNAPDRRPLRDDVRLYVVQTHSNRSVGQRPDLGLKSHKATPASLAVETIFIPARSVRCDGQVNGSLVLTRGDGSDAYA